ncbi:glycosyltransferase family 2 protein [Pontibacter sp. XAAS-A31]|nr:glycosyltransferase family 2 protein [Pontibacter harenae]
MQSFISDCVASVQNQTYKDIEVICVDNNSTDDTWPLLETIKSPRFNLIISNESKKGAPAARNKGLSIAKGEWIQFLDADDMLEPNKIEHQLNTILKVKSEVSFLAGAHYLNRHDGLNTISVPNDENVWVALANVNLGITSSNLFNKKYIDKIGGWDENLKSSQEYDLMFRLLKENDYIAYDPEPLTVIRRREGSITTTNLKSNIKRRIEHLYSVYNYVKDIKVDGETENQVAQALFEVIKELYRYDSKASLLYMKHTLGFNFIPKVSPAITDAYLKFHKILGYKLSNEILKLIKGSHAAD